MTVSRTVFAADKTCFFMLHALYDSLLAFKEVEIFHEHYATTAYSSTGDCIALAYKAGLPLKDMEFVQFHPTGLIPTGVLIAEAVRG